VACRWLSKHPYASAFIALFGRERLPAHATLSRFSAALPPEPVEALRTLFLSDLPACPLDTEQQSGGLWDRQGAQWLVFDVDVTARTHGNALCPRPRTAREPSVA
jgi:hypothetical protein